MAETISIEELEKRLKTRIGMPPSAEETGASLVADFLMSARIHIGDCRGIVQDLRVHANRVGTIPNSYPRHLDLIMKAISALIPWYTRPLQQFAQRTTETTEVLLQSIVDLADVQAHLAAQLQSWERQVNRPPGNSSSRTRVIERRR